MPEIYICPFMSFGAMEKHEDCCKERCALWVQADGKAGKGSCTLTAISNRLSVIESHLNTIASKTE